MKRILWLFLFLPVLLLPGCGQAPAGQDLTGLTFQRGNGSAWGDQLYISMTREQIQVLRYIPAGTAEPVTLEQLPVTQEQWQAITQALAQLPLEAERTSLLAKLFPKRDGGDYRRLTLICGEKAVAYRWPAQGAQLEQLLEQLVEEVTG